MDAQKDKAARQAETNKKKEEEASKEPKIELSVSSDKMEASIRVHPAMEGQTVSVDKIMEFLKANGIVYGILEGIVRDFCDNKKYFLDLVCARGLPPTGVQTCALPICGLPGSWHCAECEKRGCPLPYHSPGTRQGRD